MKKILLIVGICLVAFIGLCVLAYYYFFVGFTPEQKYEKCAKTCEDIMLREADIPACKAECSRLHKYTPSSAEEKPKETTSTETSSSKTKEDSADTENAEDIEYYCEWSWPQQIINKETKKLVYACPYAKPWCNPADYKYENVGCCATYDDVTKTKSDCTNLPELLEE